MDLHTPTREVWSQLDTLLLHVRTLLDTLSAKLECADAPSLSTRATMQHLHNSLDLVERSATGFSDTVEEMLPLIAIMADYGQISQSAADELLAPAYENLGPEYTEGAMTYDDVGAQAGQAAND